VKTQANKIFKNLYQGFTSRRTTIYLIVILSVLYSLGLFIPQRSILPPEQFDAWQNNWPKLVRWLNRFRFTSIYSSPQVIFFTALFFLNLLLVLIKRIPHVINEIRLSNNISVTKEMVRSLPVSRSIDLNDSEIEEIKERFRSRGFRILEGLNYFKGVKNRFSSIGSILFHLSFIFFLAGGLFIFHTRFWGETFVTEGQFFSGKRPEYRSVGRLSSLRENLPDISFIVEKIDPRFEKMEPISLKSYITIQKGKIKKTEAIDVNYPARLGSTSILITDVGIAPYIVITDEEGRIVFYSYVMLNIIRGDEDFLFLPETDYKIKFRFWPDYSVDSNGRLYTRSYYLNNPLFLIEVFKDETSLAKGYLRGPFDAIRFDKWYLRVGDIRYFGRFLVIDEYGGWIIISGFILSIIGLMLKLVWIRREVYAVVEKGEGRPMLLIGYRSEYFRRLNIEEFEGLLKGTNITMEA